MFILVNNKILNIKRVTTIEIDRDTDTEINYLFNNGGNAKEKFKTNKQAMEKFKSLAEQKLLLKTNDNRLINSMYIKNIEKDFFNKNRLVYILFNGAPVKETYKNEKAVDKALGEKIELLETMNESSSCGSGSVDLTPYLTKTSAENTYVSKDDFESTVGDIESLLGGI